MVCLLILFSFFTKLELFVEGVWNFLNNLFILMMMLLCMVDRRQFLAMTIYIYMYIYIWEKWLNFDKYFYYEYAVKNSDNKLKWLSFLKIHKNSRYREILNKNLKLEIKWQNNVYSCWKWMMRSLRGKVTASPDNLNMTLQCMRIICTSTNENYFLLLHQENFSSCCKRIFL